MALSEVNQILRVPGRLATSTSIATPIGVTKDAELSTGFRIKLVLAEEWGGQAASGIYCGESAIFSAVLRDYDSTALAKVFPNVSGSNVTYNVSSGTRAGTALTPSTLYFVPVVSTHPGVTLYSAIGLPKATARMQFSLGKELGLAMVFVLLPNDSGAVYKIGSL